MSSRTKRPPVPATKHNQTVSKVWSGPLPSPGDLAHFDSIITNGAERILRMTEQEQRHRLTIEASAQQASIQNEKLALEANISNSKESLGQAKSGRLAGAAVSVLAILGAVATSWLGAHPTVSIALVSVPVLGMVKALIGDKTK